MITALFDFSIKFGKEQLKKFAHFALTNVIFSAIFNQILDLFEVRLTELVADQEIFLNRLYCLLSFFDDFVEVVDDLLCSIYRLSPRP